MGEKQGYTPEVDFEAVADGVLDAIRPVVEREMREAANQLYGATLEAVQDYLSDNASFNIRSRMEAAEQSRRIEWERAEALTKEKADLLTALKSAEHALTQFTAFELDCREIMGNTNFAIVQNERENVRAAISRATGEDSPANEGEGR